MLIDIYSWIQITLFVCLRTKRPDYHQGKHKRTGTNITLIHGSIQKLVSFVKTKSEDFIWSSNKKLIRNDKLIISKISKALQLTSKTLPTLVQTGQIKSDVMRCSICKNSQLLCLGLPKDIMSILQATGVVKGVLTV